MWDLLSLMRERVKKLEKALNEAKKEEGTFPEGRLRVSFSNNRVRYYLITESGDRKGKYINKENQALAVKLARKDYNKQFIRKAEIELEGLQKSITYLSKGNVDEAYLNLSDNRRKIVSPYILTDELYAKEWQEKPFQAGSMMPEGKVYDTERGEMVRSKSEAIIANMLYELGIPYHYEKPLRLKGGQVRYPDFTLLHVRERKEIYLEHFGLLDDEEYRRESLKKMNEYMTNGIYPGKNLIFTYETKETPLNIKGIRAMLKEIVL